MIVLRSKGFSKTIPLSIGKKLVRVSNLATKTPNKYVEEMGYRVAKDASRITGENINIITGKNGSYIQSKLNPTPVEKVKIKKVKGISSKNPEMVQKELPGFGVGEVRGPLETDPKKSMSEGLNIFRKSGGHTWRIRHQFKIKPGKTPIQKETYVDGSSAMKYRIPFKD